MKKIILVASGLVFWILTATAAEIHQTDFSQAHWNEVSDSDGIKLSRWDVPGSAVPAFRGEGLVEAPIALVATVLLQTDRRHEWTPNVDDSKILRRFSKTDWVEYWHLGLPIVKDRDLVVRITLAFDPATKKVTASYHSVDDDAAPKNDHVRAQAFGGHYILTPVEDGKKTMFVYEGHADMGGSLPKWLTLSTSQEYPAKMVKGARKQVRKSDIVVSPKLQLLLDGKLKNADEAL